MQEASSFTFRSPAAVASDSCGCHGNFQTQNVSRSNLPTPPFGTDFSVAKCHKHNTGRVNYDKQGDGGSFFHFLELGRRGLHASSHSQAHTPTRPTLFFVRRLVCSAKRLQTGQDQSTCGHVCKIMKQFHFYFLFQDLPSSQHPDGQIRRRGLRNR